VSARKVTVCAECLRASCWHGIFLCAKSRDAGTTTRTTAELDQLDREHPSYYSAESVRAVVGS
jgi:hypothetical protein